MNLELKDHAVLITGGAQGIGAAITRSFAAEGATPLILDRDKAAATALIDSLGRGHFFPVELTEHASVEQAVADAIHTAGRLDVLINNAGSNDGVSLDQSPAHFLQSLQRNLVHVFTVAHFARPALQQSRGSIVNIGSKVAVTGQGGTSGYAAAKGGVLALTREWAVALASDSIRVNCICPAEVMTPMYAQWLQSRPDPAAALHHIEQQIPLGKRFTKPEEIADLAVFLASPRSGHTTGQVLFPDGGYTHLDRACTS